MKKIIAYTLTSLAILIFLFSIAIMFIGTRAIQNNEPLYIFNHSFTIVGSSSMVGSNPDSLDVNDITIIRKGNFEDIEIGDVIVFQGNVQGSSGLVIHRVVGYEEGFGFTTKGDANNNVDQDIQAQPYVTEENYQGTLVTKITFLKPLAGFANTSRNLVFGILTILLIAMIVWEGTHLFKTYKKEKELEYEIQNQEKIDEIKRIDKEKLYQEILEEEKAKKSASQSKKD